MGFYECIIINFLLFLLFLYYFSLPLLFLQQIISLGPQKNYESIRLWYIPAPHMPPSYYRAVFLLLSRNSALSRSSKSTAGIKVPSWYQTVCGSWRPYIHHYAIPWPLSCPQASPYSSCALTLPSQAWRPLTSLLFTILPFPVSYSCNQVTHNLFGLVSPFS